MKSSIWVALTLITSNLCSGQSSDPSLQNRSLNYVTDFSKSAHLQLNPLVGQSGEGMITSSPKAVLPINLRAGGLVSTAPTRNVVRLNTELTFIRTSSTQARPASPVAKRAGLDSPSSKTNPPSRMESARPTNIKTAAVTKTWAANRK